MFYRKVYRFHQAVTGRGSVPGIHVNVLAPEALWTVIGVAVPLDGGTTMRTDEIFNVALESFVHWLVPNYLLSLIRSRVRFRLGDTAAARSKFQCSRINSIKRVLYP